MERRNPVDAEELARSLYEAEYDRDSYSWDIEREDTKFTYRRVAADLLVKYHIVPLMMHAK